MRADVAELMHARETAATAGTTRTEKAVFFRRSRGDSKARPDAGAEIAIAQDQRAWSRQVSAAPTTELIGS